MATSSKSDFHAKLRAMPWHRRLAFHSKRVEVVLYLALLSGVLLWDVVAGAVGLPWQIGRVALVSHYLLTLVAFPLLVVPFWLSHRGHLSSPRATPFLSWTGRGIELLLAVLLLSGLWLALIGNRGDDVGGVVRWSHLIGGLVVTAIVLVHAWRYSLLRTLRGLALIVLAVLALMALPGYARAADAPAQDIPPQRSTSFLLDGPSGRLYSANFSAGSLSVIDRKSGERTAEAVLGGDIQRLALGPETLAVTDMLGGRVLVLDRQTLAVKATATVGGRPIGVVYDARHHWYWVALFEAGKLVAVTPQGEVAETVTVPETPRGLALLSDGRLLITHAMIGKVSLWDTTATPLKPLSTIELGEEQNPSETVSQGAPRLLDDIALSPDQTEAWLPHVLWNFDHPFQFQSTVFPAISLLSLVPGEEHEVLEHRKQLFQQINILEEGNRTRIVSNPQMVAFSADGKRVYATAAGSEDLLVFDRSRARPLSQDSAERRSRRANKLDQGGAKVVQIFRHLPGDNPRGLVVDGNDILVQNAMSLDVSRLDAGGNSSFARVTLAQEKFATLVAHDPLPPPVRRGERLFHSGNTDDFPDRSMAGDNWMSCQSCHVDGFNFTNQYLYHDTKRNVAEDAVIGHRNMKYMVAGDFVTDYLNMIRDTQGGMGGDPRFGAPNIDPENPPDAVGGMMSDLHRYVVAKENLPFFGTWMRIEANSPDGKTPHPKDWVNSAACRECHSELFDQWADSTHRLMGESNPYYMVVENLAGETEGEGFRAWCMGCHQPAKLSTGWRASTEQGHMFEKGGVSLIEAQKEGRVDLDEGTSCLMCHRITAVEEVGTAGGGNASYTVNLRDRETYVFENDDSAALKWLGDKQINAKPDVHKASYMQPFYKDPKLCGSCHGEFSPGTGSVIVNTYGEWEASPYNNPSDPSKNRTCIDCHMHGDIKQIGTPLPGQSTDGGPVKANVVTHQFTGANHHLVGLRNPKLAQMSVDLLRSSATLTSRLETTADGRQVVVRVANTGAGHKLPTGVADFREMWLQLTVTDARGQVVVQSGQLDSANELPADVRKYAKTFGRADGTPAGLTFWRHEKMLTDTRIPAGEHSDEAFALPPDTQLPVKVEARLLFRIYPQWVTTAVQKAYPALPTPEVVEMNHLSVDLGL